MKFVHELMHWFPDLEIDRFILFNLLFPIEISYKTIFRFLDCFYQILADFINIFFNKAVHLVGDFLSRVHDAELEVFGDFGELDLFIFFMYFLHLLEQSGIRGLLDTASIIQHLKEPSLGFIYQINNCLITGDVHILDIIRKPLLLKYPLLLHEHVVHIQLLQLLVCVVDNQLFKLVSVENFKPVDVQERDAD